MPRLSRKVFGWAAAALLVAALVLAWPAFNEHQRREQLGEAYRNLLDVQTWMESYHAHYKTYARTGACGAALVPEDRAKHFGYACAPDTTRGAAPGQSYTATATGKSRLTAGFVFSIDDTKRHATVAAPADWGPLPPTAKSAWLDRRN